MSDNNTHADPSEVERLRAEIESMRERVTPTHKSLIGKHAEIIKERNSLRQQLADAQALLLDSNKALKNVTREYIRTRVQFCGEAAEDLEDVVCVQAARKALSATAQPAEVKS